MPFIIVSHEAETVGLVSDATFPSQAAAIDAVSSALSVGALDRSGSFLVLDLDRAVPVAVVEVPPIVELPLAEEPAEEVAEEEATLAGLDAPLLEEEPRLETVDAPTADEVPAAELQGEDWSEIDIPELLPEPDTALALEDLPQVEVPLVELPVVDLPDLPESDEVLLEVEEDSERQDPEDVESIPELVSTSDGVGAISAEDEATASALEELLGESRVLEELEEVDEPPDVMESAQTAEPAAVVTDEPVPQDVPVDAEPADAEMTAWPWNEDPAPEPPQESLDTSGEDDPEAVSEIEPAPETESVEEPQEAAIEAVANVGEDEDADEPAEQKADSVAEEEHPAIAEAEAVIQAAAAAVAVEEEACLGEAPGYEAGECDLSALTCTECVYVNTCPNKEERTPATCGSFQWTSV